MEPKKKCILISGTMGVGKTTVCKELMKLLPQSVFLDGDWCWYSHPFTVTDATKKVVMENIGFMLQNFLRCPDYQNILFCWVMDHQEIIDEVLKRISPALENTSVYSISLIASEQALTQHLQKDIDSGLRSPDVLQRSLQRLPLYQQLSTQKLDISNLNAQQAAQKLLNIIAEK